MKFKEKKILIAVDGSPQSFDAVRYVAQNHTMEGITVTLRYFMSSESERDWGFRKGGFAEEEMEVNVPQLLRRYIEHLQKAGVDSARISTEVIMDSSSTQATSSGKPQSKGTVPLY